VGLRYRAVIFDLDGVLWDGEPLYHEAFNIVLEPLGHRVSDEDYVNVIGHGVEEAWEWMRERFQLTDTSRRFLEAYDTAVLRLLARPLHPLPGVTPLIEELKRRCVPLGVASSSLRQWVDATLRGLGLDSTFGAVVSASEVQQSKPAPDVYLLTAHRLGVNPTAC